MAIKLTEYDGGKVLEVHVSGKLAHKDYLDFVPKFERLINKHGKLRVLFDMTGFHGWEADALWDEVKLDLKHLSDIELLAVVGDKEWEKQLSLFCRPFTAAQIRYFGSTKAAEARAWIQGGGIDSQLPESKTK